MCPGVTGEILSPVQALAKTDTFLSRWGADAIIGIAGPGDPLANRETFETLALVRSRFPDARLCLCTNGLALPESVDTLADLGVAYLSVTINAIDPRVAAAIHPWVRRNGRLIRGSRAARLLIESQLAGLEAAATRGIHVKVNTVVIPTINGRQVEIVARTVAELGACVINLIPLIPRGRLAEQPEPSRCLIDSLMIRCRRHLPVFDRCRRCRADAEGIPGRTVAP